MSEAIVARMKDRGERARMYLCDGIYVSHDGYHLWLRVDRGDGIEEVALEPGALTLLDLYRDRICQAPLFSALPEEL